MHWIHCPNMNQLQTVTLQAMQDLSLHGMAVIVDLIQTLTHAFLFGHSAGNGQAGNNPPNASQHSRKHQARRHW